MMASLANIKLQLNTSRVLVVDDSAASRFMLSSFVKAAGYNDVQEAEDGQQAIEKIISWQPDIVLMDLNMPVIDGLEVCKRLRDIPNCEPVIIIQTASEDHDIIIKAFSVGVSDYIRKPVQKQELIARIKHHLERRILSKRVELEYSRIRSELKEAAIMQSSILPKDSELEEIAAKLSLDVAQYYQPSSELGGDYIAAKKISGDRVVLVSADVCGHGITSALYSFAVHNLLQRDSLYSLNPGDIMAYINSEIFGLMRGGKFITMFMCVIDPAAKTLKYAAAGSPEPLLFSKGEAKFLDTRGYPLGIKSDSEYKTHTVSFDKGDFIFLYSDALVETPDANGNCMQEEYVAQIMTANGGERAAGMIRKIIATFFSKYSKTPSDDFSLLLCKA